MYPVEYHLKKLMLDYDCVTVPGLGGFILQRKQSWTNHSKNRIYPPSRTVSFNSLLNHDDGLLISAIARYMQVSYREAGTVVSQFASLCNSKIASGETLVLDGIGELSPGPEGRLQFRQSDTFEFYSEVFGMTSISIIAYGKDQSPARLDKKPADRKIQPQKERKQGSVKWTLAISIPVILFLLYGIIFPQSIQNLYTQYSGIWFNFQYTEAKTEPQPVQVPAITAPEPEVIAEPVKQETEATVAVPTGPKYYIIGGCFESEENAGKFFSELTKRGFEAEKAGTTGHGHIRISYKSFADKASALSYLQEIREKENPSAWLLKY
jgi:hypothetical protein